MDKEKYDRTNPRSIEAYAKKLAGQTFRNVLYQKDSKVREENISETYGNKARKGGLGNLLEEKYFGYSANSISEADFPDAGVELKVTPFEKKANGDLRAGERLVLSMIGYDGPIDDSLEESHMWKKSKLLLLIYYWRNKQLANNLDYVIHYANLFTPPEEDLKIIRNDYKIIAEKIKAGNAHELSESDTMYLGACTKGVTAEKSTVPQHYGERIPARKRAFCYKNSYMTYVLNKYIVPGVNTFQGEVSHDNEYEHIIDNSDELTNKSFEQIVEEKINKWVGNTDRELCKEFGREYNNNKAQWIDLAYRMLGIKSNRAEEFAKANIVVKAIRIEENGKMRESSPLPAFKYKEIIKQNWEDSDLFCYFDETKFLYVVYKKSGDCYRLTGCQLWNMPYDDLNKTVKQGWQSVVNTIKEGVKLWVAETAEGPIVKNNFPKKTDNKIVHVRPHAQQRYFLLNDGTQIGNGTKTKDANQLPDGTWMPNYSFWLNNTYVVSQLKDELK